MKETRTLIEATCPECRGPLTEVRHNRMAEFYCLVGHVYSPRALLEAHSETEERELWAAVVVLEEAANLVAAVTPYVQPELAQRLEAQSREKQQQAHEIRGLLSRLRPFDIE